MIRPKASFRIVDRGWTAMVGRLRQMSSRAMFVKVGILGSSGAGTDIVKIALVHEYGSTDGTIPERSFLRSTLDSKRAEIFAFQKRLAGQVLDGRLTMEQALNQLGAFVANLIRRAITSGDGIPPPLAPATIEAKGSSRPLVDTGRLLASITWAIETGSREGSAA